MQRSLNLPPHLDAVDRIVQALRTALEPAIGAQQAMAVEVAVSEALTNIVVHGYAIGGAKGGAGGDISVNLSLAAPVLTLTVTDHGMPAPQDIHENAPLLDDLDPLQDSGRGLSLIRHHAQTVCYQPSSTGNRLILTFPWGGALGRSEVPRRMGKAP